MYDDIKILEIDIKNLIDDYKVIVPECQRIIDIHKIDLIIDEQEKMYKEYNNYKFLGVLSLCRMNDKYYLIDGQHRYSAMKKLYKDYGINFNIFIQIYDVNSMIKLRNIYENINKNTTLPNIVFDDDEEKIIISETSLYFQSKYTNVWSSSTKCHRPCIFKNYFEETIQFLQNYLKFENSEELIRVIEEYNNNHKNHKREDFKDKSITENMFQNASKNKFYLGLYKYDIYQDYGYDWCKKIIEYQCPNITIIKKKKNNSKKKISKTLKDTVWNTYIGDKIGKIKCPCCNDKDIQQSTFHCGHIVAESKEGKTVLENLIPICATCNTSMNSENMIDFIKHNFNDNLKRFNKFKNKKMTNVFDEKKSKYLNFSIKI